MRRGFINHLDLTVTDLVASRAFYDKILNKLGYARTMEYAGGVPCWRLAGSGTTLSIGLHEAKASDFFGFLLNEGIAILDAPAEYDYTPGYYAVFFADPDGIKLELVYEPRLHRQGD